MLQQLNVPDANPDGFALPTWTSVDILGTSIVATNGSEVYVRLNSNNGQWTKLPLGNTKISEQSLIRAVAIGAYDDNVYVIACSASGNGVASFIMQWELWYAEPNYSFIMIPNVEFVHVACNSWRIIAISSDNIFMGEVLANMQMISLGTQNYPGTEIPLPKNFTWCDVCEENKAIVTGNPGVVWILDRSGPFNTFRSSTEYSSSNPDGYPFSSCSVFRGNYYYALMPFAGQNVTILQKFTLTDTIIIMGTLQTPNGNPAYINASDTAMCVAQQSAETSGVYLIRYWSQDEFSSPLGTNIVNVDWKQISNVGENIIVAGPSNLFVSLPFSQYHGPIVEEIETTVNSQLSSSIGTGQLTVHPNGNIRYTVTWAENATNATVYLYSYNSGAQVTIVFYVTSDTTSSANVSVVARAALSRGDVLFSENPESFGSYNFNVPNGQFLAIRLDITRTLGASSDSVRISNFTTPPACLLACSHIDMADGSRSSVSDIVPGDIIRGAHKNVVVRDIIRREIKSTNGDLCLCVHPQELFF